MFCHLVLYVLKYAYIKFENVLCINEHQILQLLPSSITILGNFSKNEVTHVERSEVEYSIGI